MKRIVLLGVLVSAFLLVGCQGAQGGNETATSPAPTATSATPAPTATSATPAPTATSATPTPIEGDAFNRATLIASRVETELGGDLFVVVGEVANNGLTTIKFQGAAAQTSVFGGKLAQTPASTVTYTVLVRVPESLVRPADNTTLEKASEALLRLTAEHLLPLPKDAFGYVVIRVFSSSPAGYYATMVTRADLEKAASTNSYGTLSRDKLVGGPVYLQVP